MGTASLGGGTREKEIGGTCGEKAVSFSILVSSLAGSYSSYDNLSSVSVALWVYFFFLLGSEIYCGGF